MHSSSCGGLLQRNNGGAEAGPGVGRVYDVVCAYHSVALRADLHSMIHLSSKVMLGCV